MVVLLGQSLGGSVRWNCKQLPEMGKLYRVPPVVSENIKRIYERILSVPPGGGGTDREKLLK